MLGFLTSSESKERTRKPQIDFEFKMDVYYEVIWFHSYLHFLVFFSLFEFDPPHFLPPPPSFSIQFPKEQFGC